MSEAEKMAHWKERYAEWESSGLNQRDYCKREGLSLNTFCRWRRRALQESTTAVRSTAKVTLVPTVISTVPPTQEGALQLRTPGGWQVTLVGSVGDRFLERLLERLL